MRCLLSSEPWACGVRAREAVFFHRSMGGFEILCLQSISLQIFCVQIHSKPIPKFYYRGPSPANGNECPLKPTVFGNLLRAFSEVFKIRVVISRRGPLSPAMDIGHVPSLRA